MENKLLNNRYQILKKLGHGGFGTTYLAEDIQMPSHRLCVIKELQPVDNQPEIYQLIKERFQREAAILENLGDKHQQIPQLYAYCEEHGQFYLVQEYINGETLSTKISKNGIVSENIAQEILLNLLTVLLYVHSQKIIHRDIKPDNIIIRDSDNLPVLIDFGAVKETMGTMIKTLGNVTKSIIIGTPGFMSPEQSMGRPVYASDLYSLGLTIIYLLTGKIPSEFTTDPLTGEIEWQNYASGVSPNLVRVLNKSIQFHYQDRFPTAQAMIDELVASSSQRTIAIPSSLSTSPTFSKINVNQNWLKITLISGLTGILLASGFVYIQQEKQKDLAEKLSQIQSSSESPTVLPPEREESSIPTPIPSPTVLPPENQENSVTTSIPSPTILPPEREESSIPTPIPSPTVLPPEREENSIPTPVPSPSPTPKRVESEPTQAINLNDNQAISKIENFYNLVSNQQYDQAKKVFSPELAKQFSPKFFDQFERVTVEDLKITSRTDSMIKFVGQNTYVYLDGSTQRELRSYTLEYLNGEMKMTASEFIKVTKFR